MPIGDRTIDVSEGDLCVIAEHGYEGADTICIRKPSPKIGEAASEPSGYASPSRNLIAIALWSPHER